MMLFEVSCENFKSCNKFLSLQHVSGFFFFVKDTGTCSCFCFLPYFIFAHHILHKHTKKRKKHRNPEKNPCDRVLFIFLAMSLSRPFEVFVSQLHIPPERSCSVWQCFCPRAETTSHPHHSAPSREGWKVVSDPWLKEGRGGEDTVDRSSSHRRIRGHRQPESCNALRLHCSEENEGGKHGKVW